MRKWKAEQDKTRRVFLYFVEHPNKFFNARHVGRQVKIARRAVQRIIDELVRVGKLEAVQCHTAKAWGRPYYLFRIMRQHDNAEALAQLEMFTSYARENGIIAEAEQGPPREQMPLRVVS